MKRSKGQPKGDLFFELARDANAESDPRTALATS